jgi:hypothetical protein
MKPRYVHEARIGKAPLILKCTHSEPSETEDARYTSCKPPIAQRELLPDVKYAKLTACT